MEPHSQLTMNKNAKIKVDALCMNCKCPTKHIILVSADFEENWSDGCNSWAYIISHQIIQCQGCETISLRMTTWNSEDVDFSEPDDVAVERVKLYPKRFKISSQKACLQKILVKLYIKLGC